MYLLSEYIVAAEQYDDVVNHELFIADMMCDVTMRHYYPRFFF